MIREATSKDKYGILNLARSFFDTRLNDLGYEFDEVEAPKHFDLLFNNTISLVYEKDREILGCIFGMVSANYFCKGKTCQEIAWFVNPEHRGVGVKLLIKFEKMAKEKGCDSISMIALENDRVNEFYLKNKYTPQQHTYIKRI